MNSIQKISILAVLIVSVAAVAAVAHGAQVGPKKSAAVRPIHTNVRGEISGLDSSKFTLTTEDGLVYGVSMTPMLQNLADRKAKVAESMERRKKAMAAQAAKHPALAKTLAKTAAISAPRGPQQDPNDPSSLKDGMTVVVTIEGAVSGTTLSAISVHPIPMHKRPEFLASVKKSAVAAHPIIHATATTTPEIDENPNNKEKKGTTTDGASSTTSHLLQLQLQ
jgi:hypothetical protein